MNSAIRNRLCAAAALLALLVPSSGRAQSVTMSWSTVGDPGNAPDSNGYGAVGYTYNIGTYDVTTTQYAAFLNAVAATDPYGLYNPGMNGDLPTIGISRSGNAGGYSYATYGNPNIPAFDVTWGDAARFANWMQNGQPTGPEGPGTTETGAYALDGATSNAALMAATRNPGATVFLPSENEWYKAAYYKGGGTNAGYWLYPVQSNTAPINVLSATGTNDANFYDEYDTGNGGYTDPTNYLTPVGAFAGSPGPYGTYDMGGDVWQWNQANNSGASPGFRGSSFDNYSNGMASSSPFTVASPTDYDTNIGFRLAGLPVPEPASSVWTGASSETWANTLNWASGVVPGSDVGTTNADTAAFNQSAANSPLTIDAGRNLMGITFDLTVNSLTIGTTSGNPLYLTSGGTIQTTSVVASPEVVNAPLVLEGNYTFTSGATNGSATLSFGGGITPAVTGGTTTLTLNGSNTGSNTISGVLADNGSGKLAVAVGGTGLWVLSGATNTYSGGTTIAAGATLELAGSASALSQSMNVANFGSLVVASSVNQNVGTIVGGTAANPLGNTAVSSGNLTAYQIVQNSLTIHGTANIQGSVTLLPSGSGSTANPTGPNNINFGSTLTSLSIDNDGAALGIRRYYGTLDIGNNGLVIAYGSGADPYAAIDDMIRSGYAGGTWNGTGITSSLAHAAVVAHSTPLNIGLIDFTPGLHGDGTFTVFEGQTVTTNAVLVRLTYMDDLVLAGDMLGSNPTSDALLFAANYGTGTTWGVGDVTHDGEINSNDALLFAANYATGLPSLDGTTGGAAMIGGSTAAVPEPSSVALAVLGALGFGLISSRRRRD